MASQLGVAGAKEQVDPVRGEADAGASDQCLPERQAEQRVHGGVQPAGLLGVGGGLVLVAALAWLLPVSRTWVASMRSTSPSN